MKVYIIIFYQIKDILNPKQKKHDVIESNRESPDVFYYRIEQIVKNTPERSRNYPKKCLRMVLNKNSIYSIDIFYEEVRFMDMKQLFFNELAMNNKKKGKNQQTNP